MGAIGSSEETRSLRQRTFLGTGGARHPENENDLDGLINLEEIFISLGDLDTELPRLAQLAVFNELHTLALYFWTGNTAIWTETSFDLPEDVLKHTPHLTTLFLAGTKIGSIPEGLLAYTPQLSRMYLASTVLQEMPEDFLMYTPNLSSLSLHAGRLQTLPEGFLSPVPELEQLSVATRDSLPAALLSPTPRLIRLDVGTEAELPGEFLATTPLLESLTLRSQGWTSIPSGLLDRVPQLTYLELQFPDNWNAVPPDFLTRNIRLEVLDLFMNYTELPSDFLQRFPDLEVFRLSAGQAPLPGRLLAYAPQLTEIDLAIGAYPGLPTGLFSHAPQINKLTLLLSGRLDSASRIPDGFLESVPQLAEATIYTVDLETLPATFLAHAPQLEVLNLHLGEMAFLPESFLDHLPALTSLTLEANYLTEIPSGLLSSAPRLSVLDMQAFHLQFLPDSFMAHVPQLQRLCLVAESLASLPSQWLSSVPQLSVAELYLLHIYNLPTGFLAFAPSISHLDLILGREVPHLVSPEHHVWDLLINHGTNYRTTVHHPDVLNIRSSLGVQPDNLLEQMSTISDIYVLGRQNDSAGRLWLNFHPVYFSGDFQSYRRNGLWMAADYAVPVLDSFRAVTVGRNPSLGSVDRGSCFSWSG